MDVELLPDGRMYVALNLVTGGFDRPSIFRLLPD